MKTELQRIAIGEACGMKWYVVGSPIRSARRFLYWPGSIIGHEGLEPATMNEPIANLGWDWFRFLPDYPNDRNATFEAAQQLGEAVIKAMRFWLFELCGEMKAHHATAAQESEAILRSINKWIEERPDDYEKSI